MISALVAHLIGLGVPAKLAKPILAVAAFILALGALWALKSCYDGNVVEKHELEATAKQGKVERKADANLETQKDRDEAAAAERRKEIDNATQGIPDQAPSARQRARACVELRRQARAAGKAEPAC